jgi:hypothetical protein
MKKKFKMNLSFHTSTLPIMIGVSIDEQKINVITNKIIIHPLNVVKQQRYLNLRIP